MKDLCLVPNLSTLETLVMQTPAGRLRFSVKAKEILSPILASNGFDIENVTTVQQYEHLQAIAENRIAAQLAELAANSNAGNIDIEILDGNLDPHSAVDMVYAAIRTLEKQKPYSNSKPHLLLVTSAPSNHDRGK